MSSTRPPYKAVYIIHLLPPDTTLREQDKVITNLYGSNFTFGYSADAAHAIAYGGHANSEVVIWSGRRWSSGDIYEWFKTRNINTTSRKIHNLNSDTLGHVFTDLSRTIPQPSRIKHTVNLLPPDITLEELKEVTAQLHANLSAFTTSANAAHALVHAGNDESQIIVWSGERWPGNIFAWLNARGISPVSQQIGMPVPPEPTINTGFKFTHWPTEHKVITQIYNARPEYYHQLNSGLTGHEGLDIMAPLGSKIYAVASGRVYRTRKADNENHPYGIVVYLEHEDGYRTAYAHLESIQNGIDVGVFVQGGQLLGKADSTGNVWPANDPVTASHLHLTLYHDGATQNGETAMQYDIIDPTPFIQHLISSGSAEQLINGWGYVYGLKVEGNLATVISPSYINLRSKADTESSSFGKINNGVVVKVIGSPKNDYLPIQVAAKDVKN